MKDKQKTYTGKKQFVLSTTVLLIFICKLFTACEKDNTGKSNSPATISGRTANSNLTDWESNITEIDVLVFTLTDTGYVYLSRKRADEITSIENHQTTFNITLDGTDKPTKVLFLPNAFKIINTSTLSFGLTESEVKHKIVYEYPDTITGHFPMWSAQEFPDGISASASNLKLSLKSTPSLAKATISMAVSMTEFKMTSVQVFRTNSLIQLCPEEVDDSLHVTKPSIPAGSNSINTVPKQFPTGALQAVLYLPESAAPAVADQASKATCIVVGGLFNESTDTTYYRLDFDPPTPNYPLGEVLRDHLYQFIIKDVSGGGWTTPEEAANNLPANLSVDVTTWKDTNIDAGSGGSGGGGGGTHFLQVSTRDITVGADAGSIGSSLIFTSVFDYTLQWSDASGVTSGNAGTVITNTDYKVSASKNTIIIDALNSNSSGENKISYFVINANRSVLLMKITQQSN